MFGTEVLTDLDNFVSGTPGRVPDTKTPSIEIQHRPNATPAREKHMNTISQQSHTRLRLTRRGRIVFTTLAAIPVVIAAMVFALNGGGAIATSDAGQPLEQIVVLPGETLWQLAEDFAPNTDPRDFIAEVQSLNAIGGGLQAGQVIDIPAKYTTGE